MTTFEAGIRGGAIALLLLLAVIGWRDARRFAGARYASLFALCGIAYLIESAPGLEHVRPPWLVPIRLLSIATPGVFQLWVAAHFDDGFAPAWWRWLPTVGMAAIGAWALATDGSLAWHAVPAAALVLVGSGLWQALAGRAGDLVESRRRMRLALSLGVGASIVLFTALAFAASREIRATGSIVSAATLALLALSGALLGLAARPRAALAPAAAAPSPLAAAPAAADAEEARLLDRLRALMESERIYREEGLGIAVLAARIGLPEYRLRRLINQRLGHRNFTSFVNGYRLAEVVAALADPEQAQVPVLTIALDAGFQSLGPFNRAFKAQTGMTPTEFRRDRLGRGERRAAE